MYLLQLFGLFFDPQINILVLIYYVHYFYRRLNILLLYLVVLCK